MSFRYKLYLVEHEPRLDKYLNMYKKIYQLKKNLISLLDLKVLVENNPKIQLPHWMAGVPLLVDTKENQVLQGTFVADRLSAIYNYYQQSEKDLKHNDSQTLSSQTPPPPPPPQSPSQPHPPPPPSPPSQPHPPPSPPQSPPQSSPPTPHLTQEPVAPPQTPLISLSVSSPYVPKNSSQMEIEVIEENNDLPPLKRPVLRRSSRKRQRLD